MSNGYITVREGTFDFHIEAFTQLNEFPGEFPSLLHGRDLGMLAYRYVDHDKVGADSKFFCHDTRQHLAAGIDLERVFLDNDPVIGRGDIGCPAPDDAAPDFIGHMLDFA